MINIQFF